ncbi:MAG TPA: EAL domain-containing protein [Azonexus sp.]|nr:EAL domain-containing protein [Azonexus sp.]
MHDPAPTCRKILVLALAAIALAWGLSVLMPSLSLGELLALLIVAGGGLVLRAQHRMGEQFRLQRKIIDHTSEAMMVTDLGQRILMVNPAFERITGYSAAEVLGQTPLMLGAGRHGADFYQAIWGRVAETGSWEGEVWDRRKGGEIYPKQMRITAIHETAPDRISHYVAVFSDISAQKAQEARIDYLAHHDPLTSLPNRLALGLHLADALTTAAHRATRLAVMIIDLDNFKTVNDSLGHHAGDQLLSEIARRLQLVLDWRGRLFRLGGDEFVVVLEETGAEPVVELLERLLRAVGEPCPVLGHQLHTSPSIGISFFPTDGETVEALIRNADTAMYFAKASGRNNYQFFAEPMNAAANKRLHLESELWDALAKNQLLLHYQPQVDLMSGSVVGVEALVRWLHPQRGMIAPDDFIPVAEECGLILPLGHWVLLTACRQAKAWLDAGIDIGEMAVNISAHQFRQPEFAQSVRAVLLETGLPAERLELEITESTVMHSAEASIRMLTTLREMGIKLAIDDFGTGYSSLAYLRLFPVDRLKIDRTFVADVASDSDAASLVTSIIALGRSLGLNLVAEGVETPAQAEFLRALDCQRVQGFHFFRPVVAEEVAAVSDFFRLTERAA